MSESAEPAHQRDDFASTARLSGGSLISGYWQAAGQSRRLPVKLRRRRQTDEYPYAARLSKNMLLTTEGRLIRPLNLFKYRPNPAVRERDVLIPYPALRPSIRPGLALTRAAPAAARKP